MLLRGAADRVIAMLRSVTRVVGIGIGALGSLFIASVALDVIARVGGQAKPLTHLLASACWESRPVRRSALACKGSIL